MAQPSYLTTRLVPIGDGQAGDAESLAARLRQVPGVAEAVVIAEEKLAYLKVDSKAFDAAMAQSLAGGGVSLLVMAGPCPTVSFRGARRRKRNHLGSDAEAQFSIRNMLGSDTRRCCRSEADRR